MEQTQKDTKAPKSSSSSPPWLDLPDPLTELILERLPLLYYLRFAAVCRKWRSIQNAHRLRYSPSPPPMAPSLPFLIVPALLEDSPPIPNCFSPWDQTFHRLCIPSSLHPHQLILASSHGWLLLLHNNPIPSSTSQPSLLNPITGQHILLPPLNFICNISHGGAISAPPSDPHCTILISIDGQIFLHRHMSDHNKWIRLHFPRSAIDESVVYYAGKFYCLYEDFELHIIDPFLPVPSLQLIEMDTSQLLSCDMIGGRRLQELNGEILMLVNVYDSDSDFKGFHLFRADLSRKVWVKMEGIGDGALFVVEGSLISLLSADAGCNKNCFYFPRGYFCFVKGQRCEPWRMFEMFNLETKTIVSEQPVPKPTAKQFLLQFDRYHLEWFIPSLDYIDSAEASSSGSNELS